jgi:hypothetical protein
VSFVPLIERDSRARACARPLLTVSPNCPKRTARHVTLELSGLLTRLSAPHFEGRMIILLLSTILSSLLHKIASAWTPNASCLHQIPHDVSWTTTYLDASHSGPYNLQQLLQPSKKVDSAYSAAKFP